MIAAAAESEDVAQAHRELFQAIEALRTRFRLLLDVGALAPGGDIRAARVDVVAFCRTASRLGVGGSEVRRIVGRAMGDTVAQWHGPPHGSVWQRAAQRLVDEIYLLGEHRL